MKKMMFVLLMMVTIMLFSKPLTVYTYESMGWIQDSLVEQFENQNDCELRVVKLGDAGNVLSRLILEKNNPRADVVLGLDQSLTLKAIEEGLLEKTTPGNLSNIEKNEYLFDETGHVYPYDYGAIAVIYNPEEIEGELISFNDLTQYEDSLIIQDPRSSSTGQAFLLWTIAVHGDNWKEFWQKLKPAVLTVTSGWTEAFSKFETGEAPMMVSYATDGAYSYHYYGSSRYRAFIPGEGAYLQIEGVGVVKGTDQKELATHFIEFVLSDPFQKAVPLNQWMFPVKDVELPDAFKHAVKPEKIVLLESAEIQENMDRWLDEWERIMY